MPELPEVETVAGDLRRHLLAEEPAGAPRIAGVRVGWPGTLRGRDPAAFAAAVGGRTITAVGRRGKLLVIGLDDGSSLTVHLRMTGQLFVVPAGLPVDPHERVALRLHDGRELRFRDIRKFGRVGHHAPGDDPFRGLGPEPLGQGFTARALAARLRARRTRLKPLLLDQAFLAGVGNIYADEALWRARLHPLRRAAGLRAAEVRSLHAHLVALLGEAVERRGSSIDDYTAPDGDGAMQERLDVYQRTGLPCPRCARPVRRIVVGARATHLCTACQRLPAADRAGTAAILASMTPRPGRAASGRRGRRWTELDGEGALGRTTLEAERARSRAERTRAAAAARRTSARGDGVHADGSGDRGDAGDGVVAGAPAPAGGSAS